MLEALSPQDGRYFEKTKTLRKYFSESALNTYRLYVEIQWLLKLSEAQKEGAIKSNFALNEEQSKSLQILSKEIFQDPSFAKRVKDFEKETNHDVKAVEYTLVEALEKRDFSSDQLCYVHFACTSEDINNLAYSLSLRDCIKDLILPRMKGLCSTLKQKSQSYKSLAMMSRTHGQKASPTTLGKEFAVFLYRLELLTDRLSKIPLRAKVNGATGNYNAHEVVFPESSWEEISKDFIERQLGLDFEAFTTQIDPHDSLSEFSQTLAHLSTVKIDLCRDMWGYISFGYLKQKVKAGEVGSSTMPHKVNPIDFENAEGNFGLCISLAQHLAIKLPISRFQRDLSDSTVLRSLGSMIGYWLIGLLALEKGLAKIDANENSIAKDLDSSWELLGEALQTCLRACGVRDAYERIKEATRGQALTQEAYYDLIEVSKELTPELKERLLKLKPSEYTGFAESLVDRHYP